jgi:hypothetical protein
MIVTDTDLTVPDIDEKGWDQVWFIVELIFHFAATPKIQ